MIEEAKVEQEKFTNNLKNTKSTTKQMRKKIYQN